MGKRKTDEVEVGARDKVDLYQVLGVARSASEQEIRKAYHKLALRLHPDKNPDAQAKEKFQSLQSVIAILGDPKKREVYDKTGSIEDVEILGDNVQDWFTYFRNIYAEVTEDKIDNFVSSYQGSEAEVEDLKKLYTKYKGNMQRVFLHMICSEPSQDSHRFKDIVDKAIAADELREYKAYRKWAKEVSQLPSSRKTTRKEKPSAGSSSDLVSLIQGRMQKMDSLTSSFETKYGGSGKGKQKEPSEEEFQQAQKSPMHRSEGTSARRKKKARK